MVCVNFCEVLVKENLKNGIVDSVISKLKNDYCNKINRLYIGSYFCSQYFLKIDFWNEIYKYCKINGYKITLCIPVFSEKDLEIAKKLIIKVIDSCKEIDEITVNDYGMLNFVRCNFNKQINLGRLFLKDTRDIRVKKYFEKSTEPSLLSFPIIGVNCVELDPISRHINLSNIKSSNYNESLIAIHTPYCYMSTGNICKYGSLHKNIENKFRPNTVCMRECEHICERYFETNESNYFEIIKFGRTVYFYNPSVVVIGRNAERYIYFPINEIIDIIECSEDVNENFSPFK